MIKKNRNDFSLFYQGVQLQTLFFLLRSWSNSLKFEMNDAKKTVYTTNKNKPANIVYSINSDILLKSYFYFDNFNSPLYMTPVEVNNFFNICSKMRKNLLNYIIQNFSSNFFLKNKNRVVYNVIKYYPPILYGKPNKSLLMIKSTKKSDLNHSNNYMKDSISNIVIP